MWATLSEHRPFPKSQGVLLTLQSANLVFVHRWVSQSVQRGDWMQIRMRRTVPPILLLIHVALLPQVSQIWSPVLMEELTVLCEAQ